jgi:hypothetical protein
MRRGSQGRKFSGWPGFQQTESFNPGSFIKPVSRMKSFAQISFLFMQSTKIMHTVSASLVCFAHIFDFFVRKNLDMHPAGAFIYCFAPFFRFSLQSSLDEKPTWA